MVIRTGKNVDETTQKSYQRPAFVKYGQNIEFDGTVF
jgi:hypothetical protein